MRELSGAGEAKNDVGGLRKLSEANVERNVGNIERRTIMNEKIIVSQDGTVFNGKNIIKYVIKIIETVFSKFIFRTFLKNTLRYIADIK